MGAQMTGSRHGGETAATTATLAGSALPCPFHACALYQDAAEQDAVLVPYLKEGLEAGDRVMTVAGPGEGPARRRRLQEAGIDVEKAEREGRLQISSWDEFYLGRGHFDVEEMLAKVQEVIHDSRRLGFKRMRGWGNMEWALEDVSGVEQVAIYESRLNYILPLYKDALVCAYDTTRFSASILEDVVRAHPHLCADGFASDHPHYVPPCELLPELADRFPEHVRRGGRGSLSH